MKQTRIYLDMGVLLNISVSDDGARILKESPSVFIILEEMAKAVFTVDAGPPRKIQEVRSLIEQGVLEIIQAEEVVEAAQLFTLLAQGFQGNITYLTALASQEQACLATDDTYTIKLLREKRPDVQFMTTPALLFEWQKMYDVSSEVLNSIMQQIIQRALFEPSPLDPLAGWWQSLV